MALMRVPTYMETPQALPKAASRPLSTTPGSATTFKIVQRDQFSYLIDARTGRRKEAKALEEFRVLSLDDLLKYIARNTAEAENQQGIEGPANFIKVHLDFIAPLGDELWPPRHNSREKSSSSKFHHQNFITISSGQFSAEAFTHHRKLGLVDRGRLDSLISLCIGRVWVWSSLYRATSYMLRWPK
jgi:hypothetical protein